jgi:Replication-relaxation
MTGNNPSRVVMTDRDRELFAFLHEARLLDREQIQRLLCFGSVTRANDRLSRLHAAGLLYRYFIGTIASGRKALYAISPRGAASMGREMVWKLHRAQNELLVGEAGIEHQLAVNWCWISMRCSPNPNLIRFVRFNEPISRALPLAPDGYAELQGSGGVQPVFLEVDLTTETSRVWARKVELYLKLATSGEFQEIFHKQRFKVAVVCTSDRRLKNLRRTVRKQTTKLFYFSLLETTKRDGFAAPHWLRPEGDARESVA